MDGWMYLFNSTVGSLGYIASHHTSKELCIGNCGIGHIHGICNDMH